MFKRSAQIRGCRCIVHNIRKVMLVCNRGHLLHIHSYPSWVTQRLRVECFGLVVNQFLHCIVVIHIHKSDFPTKLRELSGELCYRPTIQFVCGNEIVSRLQEVCESEELGGMTTCATQRSHATFQGSHFLFYGIGGR